MSMGILQKAKHVMSSPEKFFKNASKEKGMKGPFIYYAAISLVGVILTYIALLSVGYAFIPAISSIFGGLGGVMLFGAWLIGLVLVFVIVAVLHLFVLLFGGKRHYANTFRAYTYGSTPSGLLGWVPILGIIFSIWSIYLDIKGISVLHKMSMGRAAAAVLTPIIIAIVVALLLVGVTLYSLGVL